MSTVLFGRYQHSTPREKKQTNAAHMDQLIHSNAMDLGKMEATSTHVTNVDDGTTTHSSDHASPPLADKVKDNRARKVIIRTVMMLVVTAVFDVGMIVSFVIYVLVLKNGHLLNMASKQSVGAIFSLSGGCTS